MDTSAAPLQLAIAATFSAEPILPALEFWMDELDLPTRITFAPYNQPFQQLLDPASLLSSNTRGINILLLRLEDWLSAGSADGSGRTDLPHKVDEFVAALASAIPQSAVSWLLIVTPTSPEVSGNSEQSAFFIEMEARLEVGLSGVTGISVVRSAELMGAYPVSTYFDAHALSAAHVPYTSTLFAALGTLVARRIYGLTQPDYKAILVDCDNTLWTGVCGEDGARGVDIDSSRQLLQDFLVRLHDRGVLLCLCTRNNEADVQAVFEHRLEMHVALRHFAAIRSNWKPKSENILAIAAELNLSPDALVFVDDDAVECAEVQANCPDVLTIRLPRDSATAARFVRHLWIFNDERTTAEARERTAFFRQNAERERMRREAPTLSQFLARLDLKVQPVDSAQSQHSRLSELTYRTNQFNLTTVRRSEAEIAALARKGVECQAFRVKDRFGDYGIVGLVLFTMTRDALLIDTFLLSCRALARGVEHRMLATLGSLALARGRARVDLPFRPSGKNRPALDFLKSVGSNFEESDETGSVFRIPADVAAQTRYHPSEQQAAAPAATRAQRSAAPLRIDPRAKAALLVSIARDLSDADAVEEQIAARTRGRPDTASPYVAPRTPGERTIASILAGMLGIDRVSIHDNFFLIGGHSLLAMQVLFKIREAFNVELSAADLYEGPFTAARLATKVARLQLGTADAARIGEVLDKLSALSDAEVRALLDGDATAQGMAPEQ